MKLKTFKDFLVEGSWGKFVGEYNGLSVRLSDHAFTPRKNSNTPRHANLSNSKILKIISYGFPFVKQDEPFIITFPIDDHFGAIVGIKIKNTIRIITMIVHKSIKNPNKIQPKRTNRYNIKSL